MYLIYIITGLALFLSFVSDREKTMQALKISYKKFINILPLFLLMLIFVSIVFYLVPDRILTKYLGINNSFIGVIYASLIGSITLMPGFIAFPLCGVLRMKGVSYMVLSAFSTTMMMVGVLSFPIEKEYFGVKVTILRNVISFFIALIVAFVTGIMFGELF